MGADIVRGDAGADSFVLELTGGRDQIIDFVDGTDMIGLTGGLEFEDLTIQQAGNYTLISSIGIELALLTQTNADDLTIDDFMVL